MYAGFTKQGGVDESAYVVGHWRDLKLTAKEWKLTAGVVGAFLFIGLISWLSRLLQG